MEDCWRWQFIRGGAQVTRVSAACVQLFPGKAILCCMSSHLQTQIIKLSVSVSKLGILGPLISPPGVYVECCVCQMWLNHLLLLPFLEHMANSKCVPWRSGSDFTSLASLAMCTQGREVSTAENSRGVLPAGWDEHAAGQSVCQRHRAHAALPSPHQVLWGGGRGWRSGWPSTMCPSTVGTEGADECRLRHSLCAHVDYYSLPIYLCFFSLSLTFKLVWTCGLIQCFIGLLVELFECTGS